MNSVDLDRVLRYLHYRCNMAVAAQASSNSALSSQNERFLEALVDVTVTDINSLIQVAPNMKCDQTLQDAATALGHDLEL